MLLAKKLEALGLSDKEAKVYTALLEMGEATPQSLATKSGINRATTYVILENLLKKNLVTSLIKKKKAYFAIEPPLQILDMLYSEKKFVEEKIGIAKKLMPELEMLERLTSERAKVKFFEGKEGISVIQKTIERKKWQEINNIFHLNEALEFFPITPSDHRETYLKYIKKSKTIFIYNPKEPIPKYPVLKNEERRYLPADKFPFHADIALYVDRAVLISYRDNLVGIVIENKTLVQALQTLFNLAWQGAEKYKSIKGTFKY